MKKGTGFILGVAVLSGSVGALSSATAFANGGMEGGGGKTVVCRNPDGSIRSTEVLDLYEGRTVYQMPYQESPDDWKSQVIRIFQTSGLPMGGVSSQLFRIYDFYLNAIDHLTFLPDGTSLKPINDSLEAVVPDGCALEQTVNYQNDNLILVNGQIWKALSETQKAALLIHESTYRQLRGFGETDSRRARHFTAFIVSGHKIDDTSSPSEGWLGGYCGGGDPGKETYFDVSLLPKASSDAPQRLRLRFSSFGGRHLLSGAYVDVDMLQDMGPHGVHMNLLDQLKAPSGPNGLELETLSLQSAFEPGDHFALSFGVIADDKAQTVLRRGISTVDESPVPDTVIQCHGLGQ